MSRRFKPGVVARQLRDAEKAITKLAATEPGRALVYATRVSTLSAQLKAANRCRDCGRPLEDPDSVAKGIGPDCARARKAGGS